MIIGRHIIYTMNLVRQQLFLYDNMDAGLEDTITLAT
jgi:hypothetical protein